jgi:hypothetical protein
LDSDNVREARAWDVGRYGVFVEEVEEVKSAGKSD